MAKKSLKKALFGSLGKTVRVLEVLISNNEISSNTAAAVAQRGAGVSCTGPAQVFPGTLAQVLFAIVCNYVICGSYLCTNGMQ